MDVDRIVKLAGRTMVEDLEATNIWKLEEYVRERWILKADDSEQLELSREFLVGPVFAVSSWWRVYSPLRFAQAEALMSRARDRAVDIPENLVLAQRALHEA